MADLTHFTDRREQIDAFDRLWQRDLPWALLFTGMSGNGKSTLIDWLMAHKCRDLRPVKIDLYSGLDQAAILERLAELLPGPAARRYRQAGRALSEGYYQARQDLLKAAAARPLTAIQTAQDHSQISQASIQINTGLAEAQAALRAGYHQQLTARWLAELPQLPAERAVIFLDTYERAEESNPKEELAWLWQLLESIHIVNPHVRVIVGSRHDLAHQPAHAWRQRYKLDSFSRPDSDRFLNSWSENELPADLAAAIFGLARGHPLLTEMAAEIWRDGRLAGRPLTPAELWAGLAARSAEEWLYGRMINRLEALEEARLVAAVRYGPLLRHFNLRSLNALLPEAVAPLDDAAFRRLTAYAFIKKLPSGGWSFHELMRDVQLAYLAEQDDPEIEACHRRAAQFFGEQAGKGGGSEAARNRLYHKCFLEPAAMFGDWLAELFQAQLAGERAWWAELLAVMEAPAQRGRLDPVQQGDLLRERGFWHVRDYNMAAALASYEAALNLFRQVGDRLGEANTLQAIGDVQNFRDENDAALASYEAALNLFRQVGSRLGEANTLKAIGMFQIYQNELEAGLKMLDQTLQLYAEVGDRVGQANTYWSLGLYLAQNGNLKEAESLIAQAVELGQQFAPGHPVTLHMESVLAQVRADLETDSVDHDLPSPD